METEIEQNKESNFKSKYYKNPEYRVKHLSYCKEKITCPSCNVLVARCNYGHHKKTQKHIKFEEILKLKESLNSAESIKRLLFDKIQQALSN
jgi:hypothetical protein